MITSLVSNLRLSSQMLCHNNNCEQQYCNNWMGGGTLLWCGIEFLEIYITYKYYVHGAWQRGRLTIKELDKYITIMIPTDSSMWTWKKNYTNFFIDYMGKRKRGRKLSSVLHPANTLWKYPLNRLYLFIADVRNKTRVQPEVYHHHGCPREMACVPIWRMFSPACSLSPLWATTIR